MFIIYPLAISFEYAGNIRRVHGQCDYEVNRFWLVFENKDALSLNITNDITNVLLKNETGCVKLDNCRFCGN